MTNGKGRYQDQDFLPIANGIHSTERHHEKDMIIAVSKIEDVIFSYQEILRELIHCFVPRRIRKGSGGYAEVPGASLIFTLAYPLRDQASIRQNTCNFEDYDVATFWFCAVVSPDPSFHYRNRTQREIEGAANDHAYLH